MKQNEQQRHLANDLDNLILRYSDEYDISYASVVGVLVIKIVLLCQEALKPDLE